MVTPTVQWRNYAQCQFCERFGAYCFPYNKVCAVCWSTDASKRGYVGTVQNDPKFLGGEVKRNEVLLDASKILLEDKLERDKEEKK